MLKGNSPPSLHLPPGIIRYKSSFIANKYQAKLVTAQTALVEEQKKQVDKQEHLEPIRKVEFN